MGPLEEMILDYFARDDWQVQQHESEPYIRFEYGNEHGNWVCLIWYLEDVSQILIYSIFPVHVPAARRSEVSEFLTRANYGQARGCFEMNLEDGETRYRTSVEYGHEAVSEKRFIPALKNNLLCYGDHLKGLEDIIAGRIDPKSAINAILEDEPDLDFRDDGF